VASFTFNFSETNHEGPILKAHVAVSEDLEKHFRSSKEPVPPPVEVRALIDTGAAISVVDESVIKQLNLKPIGVKAIRTASSYFEERNEYLVQLLLPNNLILSGSVLGGGSKNDPNLGCIIGRNILSKMVLIYIGYCNQITLSF